MSDNHSVGGFTSGIANALRVGAAVATLAGHYPWFAANNVLEARVPDWGPRRTHARRALIGFACSAVSDTTSNSIRVVKVYVQASKVPIGYAAAVSEVLAARGLGGLLWSGLPAKLLCNGISSTRILGTRFRIMPAVASWTYIRNPSSAA